MKTKQALNACTGLLLLLPLVARPAQAIEVPLPEGGVEQVTLAAALARAEHGGFAPKASRAEAVAREAEARKPLQGILPGLRVETGYLRTAEPLGAFGTLLRQREVTLAAFDPRALNHPDAISTWSSALVAEIPLINLDAWAGRKAASAAARASAAGAEWAVESARVEVVRAYYGAVLAAEQAATLEAALAAAQAHVAQATALEQGGVVTQADVLLASVKAGEVELQLAEARHGVAVARAGLAVALGESTPRGLIPAGALPAAQDAARLLLVGETQLPAERSDLRAAHENQLAAEGDEQRSYAALLPRVNAVGRLDWNDEDGPFRGDAGWTVGVVASWAPFSGGAELATAQAAAARAQAAAAMSEAAQAQASLELQRTRNAAQLSVERLRISERAVEQSAEAHRIVARKYDGGLASVSDLLDAAAVETSSRLGFAHARYQAVVTAAEAHRATAKGVLELAKQLERP